MTKNTTKPASPSANSRLVVTMDLRHAVCASKGKWPPNSTPTADLCKMLGIVPLALLPSAKGTKAVLSVADAEKVDSLVKTYKTTMLGKHPNSPKKFLQNAVASTANTTTLCQFDPLILRNIHNSLDDFARRLTRIEEMVEILFKSLGG